MTFRCTTCGETHDEIPDLGFQYPDYYFGVPEEERDARIRSTDDLCVIDEESYFIRGVIRIPVTDYENGFGIGVWISQKKENFDAYVANYDSAEIGPFFGWLSNEIPFFEGSTINLKTMAHFQGEGQRPLIVPEDSDHPLCRAYYQGLSLHKVSTLIEKYTAGE